jgi:hypothetical protein
MQLLKVGQTIECRPDAALKEKSPHAFVEWKLDQDGRTNEKEHKVFYLSATVRKS